MKNDFLVVIPARLGSKRLPGKPLIKFNGIPMIIKTFIQCNKVIKKEYKRNELDPWYFERMMCIGNILNQLTISFIVDNEYTINIDQDGEIHWNR